MASVHIHLHGRTRDDRNSVEMANSAIKQINELKLPMVKADHSGAAQTVRQNLEQLKRAIAQLESGLKGIG